MSGVKWSPVAGAGAVGKKAPQSGDDQAHREGYEGHREMTAGDKAVKYYFKDGDLKTVKITFDWVGIQRTFEIIETKAKDLVLEVYLDGKLVAIFPEPEEEPWFLDYNYLANEVQKDPAKTFIDILHYFAWPFISLAEDLGDG